MKYLRKLSRLNPKLDDVLLIVVVVIIITLFELPANLLFTSGGDEQYWRKNAITGGKKGSRLE